MPILTGVVVNVVVALFFVLPFAQAELARTSHVIKGSVACLDCPRDFDLSGVKILLKCNKLKKFGVTYTSREGGFEANLHLDNGVGPTDPSDCIAKILGGPQQLYIARGNSEHPIVKSKESDEYYRVSEALTFYKTCPVEGKGKSCGPKDGEGLGSSKTIDLPLPREWGMAPTSYYIPFLPIIGIP